MYRGTRTNRFQIRRRLQPAADELGLSRGQIVVLFGLMLIALIGIMGIAIDLTYSFIAETRMQKAADAGALAGAVYLPDNPSKAVKAAEVSVQQNGYSSKGRTVVYARQNANPIQMDVSVSEPVPTFFMRVFGISELNPTRSAHAQFNQPVPMGSPINSFGDPNDKDLEGKPLNFWASINGPCTDKAQGDPYATKVNTSVSHANCATQGKSNSEHKAATSGDPGAYDYAVFAPADGALSVELYDPEFCQRKGTDGIQDMGFDTGDYTWDTTTNFITSFSLWDPNGTPYDLTDDTQIASASYPGDSVETGVGSCSSKYVFRYKDKDTGKTNWKANNWTSFATFGAKAGTTYRVSVQTSAVSGYAANATNQFGIRAIQGGQKPSVYAGLAGTKSAMSIFNNIDATKGYSNIYLANVGKQFAGKTLQVSLFDPGEVDGNAYLSFLQPDGSAARFDWRDAGTTLGTGGTVHSNASRLQTATPSGGLFNSHWVVVTIKIPAEGYTPGWWKIHYDIGGTAHDRTTWAVEIRDTPVHLVPGG